MEEEGEWGVERTSVRAQAGEIQQILAILSLNRSE